jgi:RNA-directed DNA polymerase
VNTLAPLDAALAEKRVLGWQTKLHRWTVQDEHKHFSDVFNLLCEPATLLIAWERVKRNRGSKTAGVDGQSRWHIEQRGVEKVLGELRQSLMDGSYAPMPVREHAIPKRGAGKVRKLGIPTLRDRIVQMAATLVLEPIFEADFQPCSFGFRPRRRAQDAIEQVRFFINPHRSHEWVIEGDVEDCFGSIHHGLLMEQIRRRVTDKRVLRLIRQFLGAGVMRQHGSRIETPSGTPQGAILSPLLANVALSVLDRYFEDAWNAYTPRERRVRKLEGRPSHRMVRYADDFVVLVRGTKAEAEAIKEQTARVMREQMRLTLSPEKTRITHAADGFDFLGFCIQLGPRDGRSPIARSFPSKRAFREIKYRIKEMTRNDKKNLPLDQILRALNPVLRGWTNYYRHGVSKRCFDYLDHYLWWRIIRWLRKKHPRLTWKRIKRRYWGRYWRSPEGTRLYWPGKVSVTRYRFRGHRIPTPWTAPQTTPATSRRSAASA